MVKAGRIVLICLVVMNVPFFLYRSFSPARESLRYHEFLYHFAEDKKIELICLGQDIYLDSNLPLHFYRSPNVHSKILPDRDAFHDYLLKENPEKVYLIEYTPAVDFAYPGYSDVILYKVLPDWVLTININDWVSRTNIWKIKELTRN